MLFTDFTGKQWPCDCLGCGIGQENIVPPGGLIYESDDFVLHHEPACAIPGFLIASPRRHIHSIADLSRSQRHELMDIIARGIDALHALQISEEITVIQEERAKHLHIWLFPWHAWMEPSYSHGIAPIRSILQDKTETITQAEITETLRVIPLIRHYLLREGNFIG